MATFPSFADGTILHGADLLLLGQNRPRGGVARIATQSFTTGVAAALSFDTLLYDTDPTMWTIGSATRLIFNTAGTWTVTAGVSWAVNGTGVRQIDVRKNSAGNAAGGADLVLDGRGGTAVINTSATVTYTVPGIIVGDYVEMFGSQNSGGALTCTAVLEARYDGS